VWAKKFGEFMNDDGRAVAVDHQGNVIVTGGFIRTIDLGNGMIEGTPVREAFRLRSQVHCGGRPSLVKTFPSGMLGTARAWA